MKKILVTGNAGSGKSTLARKIAARLSIPYHTLDRVVWQTRWKKTPQDEKNRLIRELLDQDSWVIDGVSFTVQNEADTVVFLDVPRRVSFWRVTKRNWKYLFHSRPELPPGCPEALIIPKLCKIIWRFPTKVRPAILNQTATDGAQSFFHIRKETDIADLWTAMERTTAEQGSVGNGCSAALHTHVCPPRWAKQNKWL